MGCHTWFKTKSKYTLDDIVIKWIENHKNFIVKWESYCKNPQHKYRKEGGIFSDLTQEQLEWYLKVYKRQLVFVEKGLIREALIYASYKFFEDERSFFIHNNILYAQTENCPHNIFRIGNYPEDILTSLEETLIFCETNKIYLNTEQLIELKQFWNNNPIGLIKFG